VLDQGGEEIVLQADRERLRGYVSDQPVASEKVLTWKKL
jgi:hypothetical protein